jgi:hypothetical protein
MPVNTNCTVPHTDCSGIEVAGSGSGPAASQSASSIIESALACHDDVSDPQPTIAPNVSPTEKQEKKRFRMTLGQHPSCHHALDRASHAFA